ncbi:type 1 glutamine amidotransferase [Gordonia sp. NPDC003376]
MTRRLPVIVHIAEPSFTVLDTVARRAGWTPEIVCPATGDALPDLDDVQALVVLGGPQSAYDKQANPYLADEIAFLRAAHGRSIPILGLCLGSHLLAEALGGTTAPGEGGLECGLIDVAGDTDWAGTYFSFHTDTAEPPDGAQVLATTHRYRQAWRLGTSTAIQFHPELDAAGIDGLLAIETDKLSRFGIDVAALRELVAHTMIAPTPGERLLTRWLDTLPAASTPSDPVPTETRPA